jgi:hypothetical protein
MRTVQDIVNNALMSLYLFRAEAEPCVSPQSLALFDHIIADTAAMYINQADRVGRSTDGGLAVPTTAVKQRDVPLRRQPVLGRFRRSLLTLD